MPAKDKKGKNDTNAFDILSTSYLYDILDNALLDDSPIFSENNLSVDSVLGN